MEVVHFIYNNTQIDFLPTGNDCLLVNATQMAKIFDKQVVAFMRNDDTKKFISECLKSENSHYLNIEKEEDLVDSKQRSGTWMHRILALKFAAWLDPAFELWVFTTIDKIILGSYRELKESTYQKLQAEEELARRKEELLLSNPDLVEIFQLELKVTAAEKRRLKAIKASTDQLKIDFFATNMQPKTYN